ncbi:MAG: hypothetical protein E7049_05365 [Lentisphaerae bacterium]|nr:hypothetical protein [Lentisphaerota bacterium]
MGSDLEVERDTTFSRSGETPLPPVKRPLSNPFYTFYMFYTAPTSFTALAQNQINRERAREGEWE